MKKLIIIFTILGLISTSSVFGDEDKDYHKNTKGKGHKYHQGKGYGHHKNKKVKTYDDKVKEFHNQYKKEKKYKNKKVKNYSTEPIVVTPNTNLNSNIKVSPNFDNKFNVSNNNELSNSNTNNLNQNQSSNNNQSQHQMSSANNDGISFEGGSNNYEDNSVYMSPPSTIPLQKTTSFQVTTPFGGAGFSKDAAYSILEHKMNVTEKAYERGYITNEERKDEGRKLYKKFIRANKKGLITTIIDPIF